MQYLVLRFLDDFSCLAGKCPSSCCIGWKILVDREAYQRFSQMEPAWLRKEVLPGIDKKEDSYYFKNKKDGSCIMLQQDHLCKIQKYTNEAMLCNTCRKYPRISGRIDGLGCISMAASCPAFAHKLVTEKIQWKLISEHKAVSISLKDINELQPMFAFKADMEDMAMRYVQMEKEEIIYQCFEKMADVLLEVLPGFQEKDILLEMISALEECKTEEEGIHAITSFCTFSQAEWNRLKRNYISYRMIGCRIEYVRMDTQEIYIQSHAELFAIRLLAFCIFIQKQRKLTIREWEQVINLVYRLCAHGQKVSQKVQDAFEQFFQTPFLWSFVLL